jgi:PKD repeat protein
MLTPNQAEPYQFYLDDPQLVEHPLRPGQFINRDQWRDWHTWQVSVGEIEQRTGLQFFMNLPEGIRNALKSNSSGNLPTAALLAERESLNTSNIVGGVVNTIQILGISQVGRQPEITDRNFIQVGTSKVGTIHDGTSHISLSQIGSTEISSGEITVVHQTPSQVSSTEVSVGEVGSTQIGSTQIGSIEFNLAQVNLNKEIFIGNGTSDPDSTQVNITEIPHSASIIHPKLVSSHFLHDNTPLLSSIYSTAQILWHTTTPIDLAFKIQDLPTGQLAEGTITSYNTNGTPKTATITIDNDANGVGWFLDSTPQDNSEFTGTDTYFQATPNSTASGKYDLLTAILHEMGHTLGFINGYSQFDKYVRGGIFTTDTFTTKLTPDGSHLDSTLYPYDLMNTSLKPGVRKLPSAMDWAIINALNSGVGSGVSGVGTVNPAHLTAGALIGITNGDFTTPTTWNTAGATNIINGTATLTEQSQKLSELTQAFIIPTGASRLQFTIIDNHLIPGDTTKTANDAFEVALLDTNTFTPLAGTSIGLNHTDSLLNIQANGTIFKSDKVTLTTLNNKQIVTIDVSDITPNTNATLYFNLLGFGAKTSTVTIDDVILSSAPPTNTNILKPAQIEEGQSIQFQATETIPGINNPLTYSWNFGDNTTPVTGQTATHTFADNGTYKVALTFAGIDGVITTQTTAVKVDNVAPTIVNIAKPTTIKEGESATFSATATDPGIKDTLTYSWNFGDNTPAITGQAATHTFADNGDYNVILTVTDKDGGVTNQTITAKVDNVIPNIASITQPAKINEGQAATFSATATDPGIKDTLTYSWNFGDNTAPVVGKDATHTFADNGDYNVVLTVTDKDSGVTSQTTTVKVDNIAPAIVNISKPTTINEGQAATFSATVTDPGIKDTLTYSWNFGDNTNPATGKSVTHTFADNGNYNVILTVTDKDGGATTRTIPTKVDNLAPTIVNIDKPTTINKGQPATFTATANDPGILDTLTYSWNFGDTTNPVTGKDANHIFANPGNYNVILTVTDKDGGVTSQTTAITVTNILAAAIVDIVKPIAINEGQAVNFSLTAKDPAIIDTFTYSWNFGDSTTPVVGKDATHTFADNGNYNIILTATDKDGNVTIQTAIAKVENIAPEIVN